MAAPFRFADPVPQFTTATGALAAFGTVTFYSTGTTSAKNVYTDDTLAVSLGNVLTLDADGRWSEDPWLDGEYRVLVKDADGVTIWQRDKVRNPATEGLAPPDATDGVDGQALFTDGTDWYFDDVLTIPAQTGNQGKYLGTDGSALAWTAFAAAETTTPVVTTGGSGNIIMGDIMIQWGSDTAPTASALTTTKAVTFATAFSGAPHYIGVQPLLSGGVTSNSPSGRPNASYSSPTTTGFTAGFFVGEENNGGTDTITSTIPFTYLAIGPAP